MSALVASTIIVTAFFRLLKLSSSASSRFICSFFTICLGASKVDGHEAKVFLEDTGKLPSVYPARLEQMESENETMLSIRDLVVKYYIKDIFQSNSLHVYVNRLPAEMRSAIDSFANSTALREKICMPFEGLMNCNPEPLNDNEMYISNWNLDLGGDAGLFLPHYDGATRNIMGPKDYIVRAIVYLQDTGGWAIHAHTSNVTVYPKTGTALIIDFNKEYHTVQGSPHEDPRLLLKLNYYICDGCSSWRRSYVLALHSFVFTCVKATMEWAKSPNTLMKKACGLLLNNGVRWAGNTHPLLPWVYLLCLTIVIVSFLRWAFARLSWSLMAAIFFFSMVPVPPMQPAIMIVLPHLWCFGVWCYPKKFKRLVHLCGAEDCVAAFTITTLLLRGLEYAVVAQWFFQSGAKIPTTWLQWTGGLVLLIPGVAMNAGRRASRAFILCLQ